MSVPVWKRKLSSTEYVYQIYMMTIRLSEILVNKPQKYKTNYTDSIIQASLAALDYAQTADSIYLSKYSQEQDYLLRRKCLQLAKGKVQHIATACYVFLEIVRRHDYASEGPEKADKILRQELEIGGMCEKCHALLVGVMKSDNDIYRKYIKPAKN